MLERFFKVTAHLNCMYNMPYELFSGLQDIDGVDLYESDIVHAQDWNPQAYLIEYIEGGFCATYKDQFIPIDINMFYDSLGCHFKITGNAHER